MALATDKKKALNDQTLPKEEMKSTYCSDCLVEWCKMRNKVTYCSQKYRGVRCFIGEVKHRRIVSS
ncbi:MAG: hypothetical protein GF308_13085 [Candidatus Heimdallarchaeota archaeon]|nr:hypothetical protein [Candidatus Heimdallarchaeota archaeon]